MIIKCRKKAGGTNHYKEASAVCDIACPLPIVTVGMNKETDQCFLMTALLHSVHLLLHSDVICGVTMIQTKNLSVVEVLLISRTCQVLHFFS